ncbi:hypothetical protein BE08_39230 [Sorangium cellulosum]|uniref:Peptidase metallopeptidase domain-containing protein n=1 Tax=Sorangium cellulosum TaxID=56 RepID=A0A150PCM0_SORCE|nr:hypothetical protein BE08_39230 [Sorangium cellulosum]
MTPGGGDLGPIRPEEPRPALLVAHPELLAFLDGSTIFPRVEARHRVELDGRTHYLVRGDTLGSREDLLVDALARGAAPEGADALSRALFLELPGHLQEVIRGATRSDPGQPPTGPGAPGRGDMAMAITDPVIAQKVEELKARLPTFELDGTLMYVAEGDLLLDEAQLADYVPRAANVEPPNLPAGPGGEGLVGILQDGKLVRWPPGFVITYCVLRSTFRGEREYATARANMLTATRDWEATCGVSFRHVAELDGSDGRPEGVVFPVRLLDVDGLFIAAAFFPHEPASRRQVLIDPSYFSPSLGFDAVGVLRHELGHVLGFRHEHIRSGAPPVCPKEDASQTIDLTAYDPRSVMHYYCGGVGSRDLAITEVDVQGAQRVYGMPLSRFRLVA